jgi:Protein of unknown function (DUF2591)
MKTSELTGAALDWAVAKCERPNWDATILTMNVLNGGFNPSINWAQGGPIIEREGIDIYQSGVWVAEMDGKHTTEGPTPLIAAMRCYVASKLGDEVDVPEELLGDKA